jgi:hypothetical protein
LKIGNNSSREMRQPLTAAAIDTAGFAEVSPCLAGRKARQGEVVSLSPKWVANSFVVGNAGRRDVKKTENRLNEKVLIGCDGISVDDVLHGACR